MFILHVLCEYKLRVTSPIIFHLHMNSCIIFIVGKVCYNPLSSATFSGFGSKNYNMASFTSSGWCSSGSAPYLFIDLGNEYHITRVVVMGNKEQTKWSESYSLRYSHSQTLVHRSTPIKV